jgi:hypothetical protein
VVPTSVYLESAHFREGALTDQPSRAALADLVDALLDMPVTEGGAFGPPLGGRGSPASLLRDAVPTGPRSAA